MLSFTAIINISFSAGIDFRRPNLTSTDVRFWRLKSISALTSKVDPRAGRVQQLGLLGVIASSTCLCLLTLLRRKGERGGGGQSCVHVVLVWIRTHLMLDRTSYRSENILYSPTALYIKLIYCISMVFDNHCTHCYHGYHGYIHIMLSRIIA